MRFSSGPTKYGRKNKEQSVISYELIHDHDIVEEIATGSRARRNTPPGSVCHSNPDKLASNAGAPDPSNVGASAPVSGQASISALKYTEENIERITKLPWTRFSRLKATQMVLESVR